MILSKQIKRQNLTKEEELALGTKIQKWLKVENDETINEFDKAKIEADYIQAKEILFMENIPLVISRAKAAQARFPSSHTIEDLIQEGSIGLIKAIHKYDPDRGNRFSTVAFNWIRQSINRGDNKTGRMVRLPENRISDYMKMQKLTTELEKQDLTHKEIEDEICEQIGLTRDEVSTIRNVAGNVASLDMNVGGEEGAPRTLIDFVGETEASESTESSAIRSDSFSKLQLLIDTLPPVELAVLYSHCKMEDPKTGELLKPHEVRDKFGITAKTYKNICENVLENLRYHASKLDISESDFEV